MITVVWSRCSLINKFEANMTYLNIFYHCLMRYFYQNICYVKLMNCGCRLCRLTQGAPRGGNLHYTPWLCTKPKATYKLFLTYCKMIYNLFTTSTYLQSIDKVFTRYLPTYYEVGPKSNGNWAAGRRESGETHCSTSCLLGRRLLN